MRKVSRPDERRFHGESRRSGHRDLSRHTCGSPYRGLISEKTDFPSVSSPFKNLFHNV